MKPHGLRLALVASFVLCGACGCIFKSDKMKSPNTDNDGSQEEKSNTGRVRRDWQDVFLKKLAAEGFVEGWGLFSEGGYADNGQFMLFVRPQTQGAVLVHVAVNTKDASAPRDLGEKVVAGLREKLAAGDTLADHNVVSFDGLQYEFVHAKMVDGKVAVIKRLFMNSLHTGGSTAAYEALVGAFDALVKP